MDAAAHRPALQARSRRTLARITEAGLALMAQGGVAAVTVQSVVARARVSVGSFYARFASRDDLIHHLVSEAATRARDRWEMELETLVSAADGLEHRVAAIVRLLVSLDADLGEAVHERLHATAARVLLERRHEIRHPKPEIAIELGYAAVRGAARHPPAGWPGDQLRSELQRLWLGYLGASARGQEDGVGGVDFFHVWA